MSYIKAIGSAPQNAFANYKLYVDGVQQAVSSTGLDNNGRVTFAFNPILLRTGSRSIEVRADNLAGSGRTIPIHYWICWWCIILQILLIMHIFQLVNI